MARWYPLSLYPNLPVPWPTHRTEIRYPNGRWEILSEHLPIEKLSDHGYCKYCYRTHREWWLMDQRDYYLDEFPIVLCGYCEHVSPLELIESASEEESDDDTKNAEGLQSGWLILGMKIPKEDFDDVEEDSPHA